MNTDIQRMPSSDVFAAQNNRRISVYEKYLICYVKQLIEHKYSF